MRILLVPAAYPRSAIDFAGIFIRDQAAALATHHQVSVLVPRLLTPRNWLRYRRPTADAPPGVRELAVFIPNLTNRWERLTHRIWNRRMVCHAHRHLPPDAVPELVHAHFVRPAGAAAVALARRWGATVVLTEHSGPFAVHTRPGWRCRATSTALSAMDGVAAVSPRLAETLRAFAPSLNVRVLGNVVDTDYFQPPTTSAPSSDPQAFRLVFVGSLVPVKAVDVLLEAAALLAARTPEWNLEIVGDGPMGGGLQQQAARLGLGPHVQFTGRSDRAGVRAALQASNAVVLSSHSETFGVVLIEAMACGKPVVATACGGPEWVVEPETGLLVPPANPRALSEAMYALVTGARRFDGEAVRRRVSARFGPAIWRTDCEAFYAAATETRLHRRPPVNPSS
jgi:glycosyltransferase involved in cell wall biosynthesis